MSVRESVIFLIRVIFRLIISMCSSRVKLNNKTSWRFCDDKLVHVLMFKACPYMVVVTVRHIYIPRTEGEEGWTPPLLPVQVGLDGDRSLEGQVERMLQVLFDVLQEVLSHLSTTLTTDRALPGQLAEELQHAAVLMPSLTLTSLHLGLVRRGRGGAEVGAAALRGRVNNK